MRLSLRNATFAQLWRKQMETNIGRTVACFNNMKPGLIKVLQSDESPTFINMFMRMSDESTWFIIMVKLLNLMTGKAVVFVGKSYFLQDGELVYGWVLKLTAKEASKLEVAIAALEKAFMVKKAEPGAGIELQVASMDPARRIKVKEVRGRQAPRNSKTKMIVQEMAFRPGTGRTKYDDKTGKGAREGGAIPSILRTARGGR